VQADSTARATADRSSARRPGGIPLMDANCKRRDPRLCGSPLGERLHALEDLVSAGMVRGA
jgi:hypothetical protein